MISSRKITRGLGLSCTEPAVRRFSRDQSYSGKHVRPQLCYTNCRRSYAPNQQLEMWTTCRGTWCDARWGQFCAFRRDSPHSEQYRSSGSRRLPYESLGSPEPRIGCCCDSCKFCRSCTESREERVLAQKMSQVQPERALDGITLTAGLDLLHEISDALMIIVVGGRG